MGKLSKNTVKIPLYEDQPSTNPNNLFEKQHFF